jgi:hypothetical protein
MMDIIIEPNQLNLAVRVQIAVATILRVRTLTQGSRLADSASYANLIHVSESQREIVYLVGYHAALSAEQRVHDNDTSKIQTLNIRLWESFCYL